MTLTSSKVFYGWFVVMGSSLVVLGVTGTQFSFGVFLKPMTEEFGWSRATLSLAFGITFMLSGLLRPLAGYLADRYSPRLAALSGVALLGVMLLIVPLVSNLVQLYMVFAVMSIGLTLGTGPILTKIVSAWFYTRRGLTLGLVHGSAALGGMVLVPAASLFLVVFDWREAYYFLGALALVIVLPIGLLLIRDNPQDMGMEPLGDPTGPGAKENGAEATAAALYGRDATFREALGSSLFHRLTFGYFV